MHYGLYTCSTNFFLFLYGNSHCRYQWRSQTRAHTGLGPGINISINFVVVTNWLTPPCCLRSHPSSSLISGVGPETFRTCIYSHNWSGTLARSTIIPWNLHAFILNIWDRDNQKRMYVRIILTTNTSLLLVVPYREL